MNRSVMHLGHIRTLDGWRGCAIIAVIVSHSATVINRCVELGPNVLAVLSWFRLGVDLFFALSGYLITKHLLFDEQNAGVSLFRFYIKRAFRVLPPYYFYLTVLFVVSFFGVQAPSGFFWLSLMFVRNYWSDQSASGVYTNHFWSLAVEEHFYLIWPLCFLLLGSRRVLLFAVILALAVAIWRHYVAEYNFFVYGPIASSIIWRTDTRLDSILWGCIAALCTERWKNIHLPTFSTPLAIVLLIAAIHFGAPGLPLILVLIFPILILSTVQNPNGLFGKIVEWRPLQYMGRISYSLYIWQTLFLQSSDHPDPPWLQMLKTVPLCFICPFLAALFSYYIIEKPGIRFGRRLLEFR